MDTLQPSAEEFISAVRFDTALTLTAFSVLYYDYALTVIAEIEYYWSPPSLSPSFVLFVISRYVGLLGPIPVLFEYLGDYSEHRCRQLQLYHQVYAITSQAIVAVLLILRTYALYNCSKRMLTVLIGMHIGGGIQCLTAVLTSKSPLTNNIPLSFKYPGCNLSLTNNQGLHLALAWSAMTWFDTIIFVLTFYKAIQVRQEIAGGLLVTMFRDGTIYFAILVVVNIINIVTFLVTRENTPLKGMATTLTNVLSVTLTSRLMLNIRDPSIQHRRQIEGASRYQGWSTAQFSSRMMSFRPPTMFNDTSNMDGLGESTSTESTVRI